MLIARGDRIETDSDGSASFLFADESTFAVAGDARAIFEDLVFDPDSTAAHVLLLSQDQTPSLQRSRGHHQQQRMCFHQQTRN